MVDERPFVRGGQRTRKTIGDINHRPRRPSTTCDPTAIFRGRPLPRPYFLPLRLQSARMGPCTGTRLLAHEMGARFDERPCLGSRTAFPAGGRVSCIR
jgi:hypothetical protein